MRKFAKRLLTVAVALASLVGVSLVVGLDALPASGSSTVLAFTNYPVNSPPNIAGVAFTSGQPTVTITGAPDYSTGTYVTFSVTSGTGTAGAVLSCTGGTGPNGANFLPSPIGPNTFGTVIGSGCSVNLDGTGYTITATEHPDGGTAISPAFNVTLGANHLVITPGTPGSTTAGTGLNTQVTLEDANNDTVTSGTYSNDKIALQIATGPAGALLTCGLQALFAGQVPFGPTCYVNLAGTYTLEATDFTNPNITPAFSGSFTITAGTATQTAFVTSPGGTTVGLFPATFPVAVAVEDAFGNIELTDSSTSITLGLYVDPNSPVPTTLACSGGGTQTAFLGVATFACTLNLPGNGFVLEAFSGYPTVYTAPFNVNVVVIPAAVTTLAATAVNSTTATLNGSLNPGGVAQTCHYLWGTSNTLSGALSTGNVTTAAAVTPVSVPIGVTGLTPGLTYYFELVCSDGTGLIVSFVTPTTATVATAAATPIASTTATLNGSVNPGGVAQTCYYLYGTSATLAGALTSTSVVTAAVTTSVTVPITVTGLTPGITYYFELVCSPGGNGLIVSFTTNPTATPPLIEIFGQTALGTSIATSQAEFPTAGSAGVVVLARSDSFSDALAGVPLAAAFGGPLLITPGTPLSSTIDPGVLAEIQRVLTPHGTVYILGGALALSPNIDTTLAAAGYTVIRVAGINLFATAVDIAGLLGNPSTIFEATGLAFQDALSAGPAAILTHGAILLTNGASQAPETAAYLGAHPGDTRYAIGGVLAAAGADPTATAVAGLDLYGTSAAVAQFFFAGAHTFAIATGLSFSDALGGGLFIATGGRSGPMLLVTPNLPLPPTIAAYLATLAVGTQGYSFGGPLAISSAVLSAVQLAVG